jgi:hypothetical protein
LRGEANATGAAPAGRASVRAVPRGNPARIGPGADRTDGMARGNPGADQTARGNPGADQTARGNPGAR